MKYNLYTVKDVLVGHSQPFVAQNDAVAQRMFVASAKSTQPNIVNTNPEHKELWKIGSFDDVTGILESEVTFIDKASSYCKEVFQDETKEEPVQDIE